MPVSTFNFNQYSVLKISNKKKCFFFYFYKQSKKKIVAFFKKITKLFFIRIFLVGIGYSILKVDNNIFFKFGKSHYFSTSFSNSFKAWVGGSGQSVIFCSPDIKRLSL